VYEDQSANSFAWKILYYFLFVCREQCVNLRSKEMTETTRLVLTRIIRAIRDQQLVTPGYCGLVVIMGQVLLTNFKTTELLLQSTQFGASYQRISSNNLEE
jgi:hypothetical protein